MSGGTVRSSHHRTLVNGCQKGHICQMTKRSEIVKTSHFSCPFSAIVGNLRSEEAKWCNLCNVTDELGIFIGRAIYVPAMTVFRLLCVVAMLLDVPG